MKRLVLLLAMLTLTLTGYGIGVEQYIPIGQSPGVSGKLSKQGVIKSLYSRPKYEDKVTFIQLEGTGGFLEMNHFTTVIYLDFSKCKLPNKVGNWSNIRVGTYVEVFVKRQWIKAQQC
jgi:hypothetical protein